MLGPGQLGACVRRDTSKREQKSPNNLIWAVRSCVRGGTYLGRVKEPRNVRQKIQLRSSVHCVDVLVGKTPVAMQHDAVKTT
jgi:hypothetical protein